MVHFVCFMPELSCLYHDQEEIKRMGQNNYIPYITTRAFNNIKLNKQRQYEYVIKLLN